MMFERVLVATDGSACGDHAFAVARSMVSRELGSELTVVHIAPARAKALDDANERLGQTVTRLAGEGVRARLVTPAVRFGGPAHAIAETADEVDADVILVGDLGAGPQTGAVSVRLLQTAHRPVMVIPMPDDQIVD
ncbi:universal stress protein [Kineosporia sp. J2-2]|uniref:Universal stress protein n=1 Tax=Kineosporia corallincola TaxID=2835133 RepID=A0ABS5TRI3_9ACTN|nr:universal stress protein [Kineosporia corallincola]MBT0773403.1 universal stress protein [Kineosporia corallincola]